MLLIDSENASHPLNQSGVKITPTVTLSFTFSRALGSFTLSSHWLHEIPSFLFLCLAMVITFNVSSNIIWQSALVYVLEYWDFLFDCRHEGESSSWKRAS